MFANRLTAEEGDIYVMGWFFSIFIQNTKTNWETMFVLKKKKKSTWEVELKKKIRISLKVYYPM